MKRPRILMISTALSQPRHQRRAADFIERGYAVHVYGFGRGVYEDNSFPEQVVLHRMGQLGTGRYLRRGWHLLRAIGAIRAAEAGLPPPAFVYALGPDSALLASALRRPFPPLVYEIGDLRLPEVRSVLARGARLLEQAIVRRAAAVVLTAPSFADYYKALVPDSGKKIVIAENRLPTVFRQMARPETKSFARPLRIAFVGNLRYPRTLLPVVDAVATRADELEMHIFGDGPLREAIEQRAATHPNVNYHGPFRNPEDLAAIYSGVDLNCVVYDNTDANVRLAIPNKLYESAFFGVPMVVAAGTKLAERVKMLRIGFDVEPSSGFAEAMLSGLQLEGLESFSRTALNIPSGDLINDGEWLNEVLEKVYG